MANDKPGCLMWCIGSVGLIYFAGVLIQQLIEHPAISLSIVFLLTLVIILCVKYGQKKAVTQPEGTEEERKAVDREKRNAVAREERKIAREERKIEEEKMNAEKERKKRKIDFLNKILLNHSDIIDKFLEIAYRKVSIIDEYGDEDWSILNEEMLRCIFKIAQQTQKELRWGSFKEHPDSYYTEDDEDCFEDDGNYRNYTEDMKKVLKKKFETYYKTKKGRSRKEINIEGLSGIEFETFISEILKKDGYLDVSGTPATGDQGADILAKKDGKTIVIQAKRWEGTVGNKAVQEVIGALKFYAGDEGWVVTNSLFTSSAKALAHKANIRLVDGNDLKDWVNKIG